MPNVKVKVTVTYTTELDPEEFEYEDLEDPEGPSSEEVIAAYREALENGDILLGDELENDEEAVLKIVEV